MARALIFMPLVLAFTSDSGAYFAGRAFGKHKLAPVISPKKTVEGAIGGVASTVLFVLLYGLVLQLVCGFQVHYWAGLVYGIAGAVCGMVGDLMFSVVKRQAGIKDYGNVLPGHGRCAGPVRQHGRRRPRGGAAAVGAAFAVK